MKKIIAACLLFFALFPAACSGVAQPTPTSIPAPIVTATRAATRTPLSPMETPSAASEWEGIPIMPGAVAGDGDEDGYVFTIQATTQQVQEYYERELGGLGWTSSTPEAGEDSLILTFTKDVSEMLTISVLAKGDEVLVLLVK